MKYVVVTITYFLLIGFLLWKNEAGTYIRHMTPHHLVCILKTPFHTDRSGIDDVPDIRMRLYALRLTQSAP